MIAMAEAIVEILPFALGVFASPLPVILAILLLFSAHPRATSASYVVTWVAGLTLLTVAFTLLAGVLDAGRGTPAWVTWVRIGLGALLLLAGVRQWLARAAKAAPPWLAMVMDADPRRAVRFGLLMSVANPKEILMAAAAGLTLGATAAGAAATTVALLVFVVVGAASVVAPLLVFLIGGRSALDALARAREWLQRNNAAVTAAVLVALGAWLVLGGIAKLA
jgi:threonine/homoserine/homoserine lactone efflux protein